MSTLKEALRDIKQDLLLKDDEESLSKIDSKDILVRIAIAAIRRLELAISNSKEGKRDIVNHGEVAYEEYRSIARSARKSLQRLVANHIEKIDRKDLDLNNAANPKKKKIRKEEQEKDEKNYPMENAYKEEEEEEEEREKLSRIALDMGQYTTANAFDGNLTKQAKFSRLMGGAKKNANMDNDIYNPNNNCILHPTHAADPDTMKRIQHDLEAQFDASVHHKGKKGLGA